VTQNSQQAQVQNRPQQQQPQQQQEEKRAIFAYRPGMPGQTLLLGKVKIWLEPEMWFERFGL
jgi:hypothetical protein